MWLSVLTLAADSAIHEVYVTVPGAKIFYRDTGGKGVPLILLHAATGKQPIVG